MIKPTIKRSLSLQRERPLSLHASPVAHTVVTQRTVAVPRFLVAATEVANVTTTPFK